MDATQALERRTTVGSRLFRCRPCRRIVNERTGTPVNQLQVPTDIGPLVVLGRLRYTLRLRELAERVLTPGVPFTHETVHAAAERCAPLLRAQRRATRREKAGRNWHAD